MRFISWNVNGLRACVNKGFMDFLRGGACDAFCLQETKMERSQADFDFGGWHEYWNSAEKKGYSGTAVLSRQEPLSVSYGLGLEEHDHEGRVITCDFGGYYLVNCYTPNSQRGLTRLEYRMTWEDAFRAYLTDLKAQKPMVLCGDLNVAHREIDIKNAKTNEKNAGFTPEEREKMSALLDSSFVDTFRALYPDKKDAYSWWSYMGNARERNIGWRIDYFIVSEDLRGSIREAEILPEVQGSDHCPVTVTLEL